MEISSGTSGDDDCFVGTFLLSITVDYGCTVLNNTDLTENASSICSLRCIGSEIFKAPNRKARGEHSESSQNSLSSRKSQPPICLPARTGLSTSSSSAPASRFVPSGARRLCPDRPLIALSRSSAARTSLRNSIILFCGARIVALCATRASISATCSRMCTRLVPAPSRCPTSLAA